MASREELRAKAQQLLKSAQAAPETSAERLALVLEAMALETTADALEPERPAKPDRERK